MSEPNIRVIQARRKRRICRDLKRLGITKLELSTLANMHYNTVKRYLNHEIQGWSADLITRAEAIIQEREKQLTA